jgi:hypothetical protein
MGIHRRSIQYQHPGEKGLICLSWHCYRNFVAEALMDSELSNNWQSNIFSKMQRKTFLLLLLIGLSSQLRADIAAPPSNLPWLTGPIVAPPGTVVQKGHYTFQPFFYVNVYTGIYDSHWRPRSTPNFYNATLQFQVLVGITEWMDFQANPTALYNNTQGQSAYRFGDLPLGFDFQLLNANRYEYFPGIKLQLLETFPTGKYQKLNPKKLDTDVSGLGSFSTNASLVFYKVYHLSGFHYLSTTLALGYTVFAPVHVKGLSTYEGGFGTRGKVYPGNAYSAILSFEYTFNKHWVFCIDNVYIHNNKTRFSGKSGFVSPGVPAVVGFPSSEQLSFAPGIEYNFNEHWGIVAGSWFSALGRNSLEFRSGIFSFLYSY